jgi:hypothetical protein
MPMFRLQNQLIFAIQLRLFLHHLTSCLTLFRDRPFNLQGGYDFLFRSEFFFRTTRELEYLFDKNSESDYVFFPPPKSEYFFQQHWVSEYFFRKKTITPSPSS